MSVSTEDYHIWQFPEFTSTDTDTTGQYCCTDRGIFKVSTNTVEVGGYTFGKVELYLRPVDDVFYNIIAMSSISDYVFNSM